MDEEKNKCGSVYFFFVYLFPKLGGREIQRERGERKDGDVDSEEAGGTANNLRSTGGREGG